MHINALFVCSLVPGCRYARFDESGQHVDMPVYLATASLLPIALNVNDIQKGGTWWPTESFESNVQISLIRAREKGVATVVVTQEHYEVIMRLSPSARKNLEVLIVPHLENTLFAVSRAWRAQCMVPVIAVTGSIGKSTTIAMLNSIFSVDRLPVLISAPTDNLLVNLALDILHITGKHVAAVFEVGAMQAVDMMICADLLRPTIAIITAICPAHLQGMRALDVIASEKQKIFSYFSPSQVGIVCGDYPVLTSHAYEHPVVRFGLKNKNVITARKVTLIKENDGTLKTKIVLRVYDYEQEIILHGHHRGIICAALAAAALAHFLYIPFDVVVRGILSYIPLEGRFYQRSLRNGRGLLIQDNYSISPESVKAALHAVHAIEATQRKIAVIGNIPDLGEKTNFWHRHVGRELIKTRSISDLILVGDDTKPIRSVAPATMNVVCTPEWGDAESELIGILAPVNNIVLVTGAAPLPMNHLVAQLT